MTRQSIMRITSFSSYASAHTYTHARTHRCIFCQTTSDRQQRQDGLDQKKNVESRRGEKKRAEYRYTTRHNEAFALFSVVVLLEDNSRRVLPSNSRSEITVSRTSIIIWCSLLLLLLLLFPHRQRVHIHRSVSQDREREKQREKERSIQKKHRHILIYNLLQERPFRHQEFPDYPLDTYHIIIQVRTIVTCRT